MATSSASGALGFETTSTSSPMTQTLMTFGTFNNSIHISSLTIGRGTNSGGYLSPNASNKNRTLTFRLKGSTSGSVNFYSSVPPSSGENFTHCPGTSFTINGDFVGTVTMELTVSGSPESYSVHWGNTGTGYSASFEYEYNTTNCTAPTSVSLSRIRNQITVSWSGAAGGINNSINKYSVYLSTSSGGDIAYVGSTALHTYVPSTATSGSHTFTVSNSTTYYGAVCTMGTAGDGWYSTYKWSSSITVPAKPSVSAGTVITDTQMDTLRTYINVSGITDITDGSTVAATAGNTYRGGLTAGTSKIEASWYNAAADG